MILVENHLTVLKGDNMRKVEITEAENGYVVKVHGVHDTIVHVFTDLASALECATKYLVKGE